MDASLENGIKYSPGFTLYTDCSGETIYIDVSGNKILDKNIKKYIYKLGANDNSGNVVISGINVFLFNDNTTLRVLDSENKFYSIKKNFYTHDSIQIFTLPSYSDESGINNIIDQEINKKKR